MLTGETDGNWFCRTRSVFETESKTRAEFGSSPDIKHSESRSFPATPRPSPLADQRAAPSAPEHFLSHSSFTSYPVFFCLVAEGVDCGVRE